MHRLKPLVALCALTVVVSGVGPNNDVRPRSTTDLAPDVVTVPTSEHSQAQSEPALPVSRWLAADAGNEADAGYAPPGAQRVAGINWLGSLPWQVANGNTDTSYIWGYATAPSYLPSQTIDLKVSTTAPSFDVSLWRYNNTGPSSGRPFVLVTSQTGLTGSLGSAPAIDRTSHMIVTSWAVSAHVGIPGTAPSGVYLLRLSTSTNVQSYVPIVVRRETAATYLYVVPSMTWQAYNVWGGTSLYQSLGIPSAMPGPPRARAVSYDRPYLAHSGFPMFGAEDMVIIGFLQQNNYDVAYTTDTDLSIDPSNQPLPEAVIIGGHSEYWTTRLYDWLNTNINQRGRFGLASFGANSGFWMCTMADAGRTERCLKRGPPTTSPGKDALRDVNRPEQAIFGAEFGVIAVGGGPLQLSAAAAATGLLSGTNLRAGSSLGLIGGYEVDQVHTSSQCSILRCRYDVKFATGTIKQRSLPCSCPYDATPDHSNTMIRILPSGRRVFAAGTLWWGFGLDPAFAERYQVPDGFIRLMKNILAFVAH